MSRRGPKRRDRYELAHQLIDAVERHRDLIKVAVIARDTHVRDEFVRAALRFLEELDEPIPPRRAGRPRQTVPNSDSGTSEATA